MNGRSIITSQVARVQKYGTEQYRYGMETQFDRCMTTRKRPLAGIKPALSRILYSTLLVQYCGILIVNSDARIS